MASWEAALGEDWLGQWAMSQMLINVSTRKFARSVRLLEGEILASKGAGVSKSAASRRFVALSAERMQDWMAAALSKLDRLVIQLDGIHIRENLVLLAAVGLDGEGEKHPLTVMEGATENAAVCQALLDNLTSRRLDPQTYRLFVIDGSKALAKAIRATFGPPCADPTLPSPLCRSPDYADQRGQAALEGGDRCEGCGIIRAPRERREACQGAGSGLA